MFKIIQPYPYFRRVFIINAKIKCNIREMPPLQIYEIIPRKAAYAACVFFFSLFICLLFARLSPIPKPYGDSPGYLALAKNVAAGNGFSSDGVNPSAFRPPLFSVSLGLWFKITNSSSPVSAAVFQSIMQSLGVLMTFLLLSEIFSSIRIALYGSLFAAANPILFAGVVYVLQEPILFFVTTLAAWITVKWLKERTILLAVAAGLCWGSATLAKIVTWYVPALLWMMWLFFFYTGKFKAQMKWKQLAVLTAFFLLVIAPWSVRNYRHFGRFILVNEQGTAALRWFVSHGRLGDSGGRTFLRELEGQKLSDGDFRKSLRRFILDRPVYSIAQIVKNFFWFTQLYREWFGKVAGLSMRWHIWIVPAILFQLPLYIGFALTFLEKRLETFFLVSFYLIYWLQYTLCWGEPRYAIPVYPVLLCLGLLGLSVLIRKREI